MIARTSKIANICMGAFHSDVEAMCEAMDRPSVKILTAHIYDLKLGKALTLIDGTKCRRLVARRTFAVQTSCRSLVQNESKFFLKAACKPPGRRPDHGLTPQPPARDTGSFGQRLELSPGDVRMHFIAGRRCRKAAIVARNDILAADHACEALDSLCHQFGMLHLID